MIHSESGLTKESEEKCRGNIPATAIRCSGGPVTSSHTNRNSALALAKPTLPGQPTVDTTLLLSYHQTRLFHLAALVFILSISTWVKFTEVWLVPVRSRPPPPRSTSKRSTSNPRAVLASDWSTPADSSTSH